MDKDRHLIDLIDRVSLNCCPRDSHGVLPPARGLDGFVLQITLGHRGWRGKPRQLVPQRIRERVVAIWGPAWLRVMLAIRHAYRKFPAGCGYHPDGSFIAGALFVHVYARVKSCPSRLSAMPSAWRGSSEARVLASLNHHNDLRPRRIKRQSRTGYGPC